MKKGYYVVWVGRVPGPYETWSRTDAQVNGYRGAKFDGGFATRAEAEKAYLDGYEKWITAKRDKDKGGPPLF